MSWTLCTSGSAIVKAGVHANATLKAGNADIDKISEEVEGRIARETNNDWVANHTKLSTAIKNVLSDTASAMAGNDILCYDNTGYIAREADMIMNKNIDVINKNLKELKEKGAALRTP